MGTKTAEPDNKKLVWWKHGVVYHIYPRSFYDSNNDGIGDLNGIIQKLEYLKELGVSAVWLSPVYVSPQVDFGYDVSDYKKIDPIFGNLADFKKLLSKAHKLDIRIIIDMILNHTSIEHKWFVESRSSETNAKRDWYIWKKGKGKKPPNNWKTSFGQCAWTYDNATQSYYYHSFFKEQPDLNWRNPEVKKAMFKTIKFWLNLGVDGLRLDVINLIAKDKHFRNNRLWLNQFLNKPNVYTRNRPKSINVIKSLRKLLDEYTDSMCVGEIYTLPPGDSKLAAKYLGNGKNALHLAFDFSLIFRPWSAKRYAQTLTKMYSLIPEKGWPCHVLSNHDLHRNFSKPLLSKYRLPKAKLKALMLLTLRGTPFIYYGEEIGMENTHICRNMIRDTLGKQFWPIYNGRDKARTPMQWNDSKNAGFSGAKPWLPLNKNYKINNVQHQMHDKQSLLNLFRNLIAFRNGSEILQKGDWELIKFKYKNILAYRRIYNDSELIILLNFSFLPVKIEQFKNLHLVFTTHFNKAAKPPGAYLSAFEGQILAKSMDV